MKKLIGILVAFLALGGTALAAGNAIVNNNQAEEVAINQAGVEQAYDDIGADKAKEIALKEVGVAEADAIWVRVERDYDDGRLEYSVEFHVGRTEYDLEIDAKTGNVLERDIDVDDDRFDDGWDDRWDD